MKIPNVQQYEDYRLFISDLYNLNRMSSGVGSFRYFAKRLKWPSSYMSDVIQGRKNLTVQRALELGLFLKLDAVDLEHILCLTWQSGDSEIISNYFQKRLKVKNSPLNEIQKGHLSAEKIPEDWLIVDESIYSDISLLAIFEVISWKNGRCDLNEISQLLYTFEELKSLETLEKKIGLLEKHNIVIANRKDGKIVGFEKLKNQLIFNITRENSHYMKQYAKNVKAILSDPRVRGVVGSGFYPVSKKGMIEIKKRIFNLRNYVHEISQDCMSAANSEDSLIFQFDLNFLLLLDSDVLKVENLNTWMESSNDPQGVK